MTPERRHTVFLCVSAAIAIAVVAAAHTVMLPFVLAAVIAYLLAPAVAWVEKRRVPRPLAIVLVYIVVLGSLGLFVRFTAPRVGTELAAFRRELPQVTRTIRDDWVPAVQTRLRSVGLGSNPDPVLDKPRDDIPSIIARPLADGSVAVEIESPIVVHPGKGGAYTIEPFRESKVEDAFDADKIVAELAGKSVDYVQHNAIEIVKFGRNVIAAVSRIFFVFGITLMLAAYTILTRERIGAFFLSLLRPKARPSAILLAARIDRGLAGVVRGQLVICVLNGILSAIGFGLVGLKYWPVLAIVASVLSLVPIFGSIAGAIPAVALGLTQSVGTAAFVLFWIIGVHQMEANVLNPKIMGDAAKLHPVLVVFSLLVGEHFFGVVGALLAVPTMSIAQSVFLHFRQQIQLADPEMAHEPVGSLPPPPPT